MEKYIAIFKKKPFAIACALSTAFLFFLGFVYEDRHEALEGEWKHLSVSSNVLKYNVFHARSLAADLKKKKKLKREFDMKLINPDLKANNYYYFFDFQEETGTLIADPIQGASVTLKNENAPKDRGVKLVTTPFNMHAEGHFHEILDLISQVQMGRHFARFRYFSIQKEKDGAVGKLNVTMDVSLLGRLDEAM